MTDEYVICWICCNKVLKDNAEMHDGVWVCKKCWQRDHD